MVSGVTPPDTSISARPATRATASRTSAGVMLSSSSRGAPAASAASISASSRTSTVSGRSGRAARARRTASPTPPASAEWFSLIEDRVVEPGAVVDAAAVRDRRLLQPPQPGRGLARVEQLRGPARAAHRGHHARGQRGDPRQAAEEVQRRPLAGQQRPRVALDHEHDRARLTPHALRPELEPRGGIEAAEDPAAISRPEMTPGAFWVIVARPRAPASTVAAVVDVTVADVLGERRLDQLVVGQLFAEHDDGAEVRVARAVQARARLAQLAQVARRPRR